MRWLRSISLALAAFALAGCGAAKTERAQQAGSLEPAPPIEAIDEPAPGAAMFFDKQGSVEESFVACQGRPGDCKPPPGMAAELKRLAERRREATAPAEGSQPRAIARLQLPQRGRNAEALLAGWRARSGKLCTWLEIRDPESGGGTGPSGPCTFNERCADMCLQRHGSGRKVVYLLAGTVAARADEIRIVFVDGAALRYPLNGPLVPGFPEQRVFMVDLGPRFYQQLELLMDEKILERIEASRLEIESAECVRRFPARSPPNPSDPTPEDPNPELTACLGKAGNGHG